MPYNLASPSGIAEPCDLANLSGWFNRELAQLSCSAERNVLAVVADALDEFVRWPSRALLLWQGCDRVPDEGEKQKYFSYPQAVKAAAKAAQVTLDTRPNGPAIAAFLLAGGDRPARFGSSNSWSIHHLYSGKFPYLGRNATLHATKSGAHFTQSAGLVAVHPLADALADEFPFFAWHLRAGAFHRFGYDPDGVFSTSQSTLGFAPDWKSEVLCSDA